MRKQLTEPMIEKINPPQSGRTEIFDAIIPALALRVTANGAKSFVVRGRVKGIPNPVRITIGDARGMKVSAARKAASDLLKSLRAGEDPREIERAKIKEVSRQRKQSFNAVAEEFIEKHLSKLRSGAEAEKVIRRHLLKHWDVRPIAQITPDDVGERIRTLVDDGTPHLARLVLAHAKRLFRWAAAPGRSYIKVNPCWALSAKKDFDIEHVPRQVVLGNDHLRLIWKACDTLGAPVGRYFQMLLLSGQRRTEVADMTWDELDLTGDRVWNVSGRRMKATRPHEVPLTAEMIALLAKMKKTRGEGPFVFSTTGGKRPISGFSKAKTCLDAAVAKLREKELLAPRRSKRSHEPAPLPDWRLHDLRRTVRTALGAFPEIAPNVRELVIAHVPAELVRTYDLHAYRDEKRKALELWNQRLMGVVAPPAKGATVMEAAQ